MELALRDFKIVKLDLVRRLSDVNLVQEMILGIALMLIVSYYV